jgi:hypothetical protein
MDLFSSPLEDEEMSLRELAMPSMEDIEMQKSEYEWEGVGIEQVLQEGPSPQSDSLCAIEAYTLTNQDMEALKDEENSE